MGVVPAHGARVPARLLAALAEIFPVTFEGRSAEALEGLDGVLVLGGSATLEDRARPRLPAGIGALLLPSGAAREGARSTPAGAVAPRSANPATAAHAGRVRLAGDERLARALRGRVLLEDRPAVAIPGPRSEDLVLATMAAEPVWWARGRALDGAEVRVSAFPLEELAAGETLRDQLRPGRFMGLLPLLAFVRGLCGGHGWTEPPLRAAFVVDDPNLHSPTYGFLDYRVLARHAAEHGYHVGLAMVPLDGWLVSRRAAALLRHSTSNLSLLVHGNDHVARELGRLTDERAATRAIAQALRRVERFEARSGVSVSRVMAPPHGACSEASLRAMFRLGFDAACISRPLPWIAEHAPATSALSGWHMAELVAGGIPVLPRIPLDRPREELVFRALLGQPLILYGHHGDFELGLDVLAQAAQDVGELGHVRWSALHEIAEHSYRTRTADGVLDVELYSRRARVAVPPDAGAIRVHLRHLHGEPGWLGVQAGARTAPLVQSEAGWSSDALAVRAGGNVEVRLIAADALHAGSVKRPRVRAWPLARRVLVEGRDRMRPTLASRARTR